MLKTTDILNLPGPEQIALLRAVLEKGVPCRFRAGGHSMSPFIRDGDLVTVSPPASAPPGQGAVVAFNHPDMKKLVIHRVVGRRGEALLLKGDSSPRDDGPVARSEVLGRVTRLERDGRRVRLGLGPERLLIAFLSRRGLLPPLWAVWGRLRGRLR